MLAFMVALLLTGILQATGDDGIGIDPHGGGVRAAACRDEGNGLDPHGGPCTQGAWSDEGSGLDPHG